MKPLWVAFKVPRSEAGPQVGATLQAQAEVAVEQYLSGEKKFYNDDLHTEHIAVEEYARKVFLLVAWWIAALFLILLAQGSSPTWHPFSDKVLIALISSMTINLIGTLVIVLFYIFKSDQHR